MICLDCEHVFCCATYLIDDDHPNQPIDPKDIADICKVMGGFKKKERKQ